MKILGLSSISKVSTKMVNIFQQNVYEIMESICKFRRPKKGNRIVETAKIVQTNFKTTLRNVKQSSQNGIKSFLKSYLKFFVHSPKSHDIFSNMTLLMKTIPIN